MDVFELRERLVREYRRYAESFVEIKDDRVQGEVSAALDAGLLWPHPRIGLNPAFEPGPTIDELVESGRLQSLASEIFRVGKSTDEIQGYPLTLYRHQSEAIEAASAGRNYVLTTGTGSGKSMAYIVPIVDHVLRTGSGQGVKALVLYPMNALANSQNEELSKFLDHGPWATTTGGNADRPVTFAVYTGQQGQGEREEILSNPPDILLTNYVMAELILTRCTDQNLVRAMSSLRFLVLDELHTHRGRQGADVAMLVRRIREASRARDMRCVGTSATLSTAVAPLDPDSQVAEVASKLFGAEVRPVDVISETLMRVTADLDINSVEFTRELSRRVEAPTHPVNVTREEFSSDPLSIWIESTFGVTEDASGRLVRATPIPIAGPEGGGEKLAASTGLNSSACEKVIQDHLLAALNVSSEGSGRGVFAFRLHQFLSAGDTVYATPEAPDDRQITMRAQRFVRDDRNRSYLPLSFCRRCGQEYYIVRRAVTASGQILAARDLGDTDSGEGDPGFLFIDPHRDALGRGISSNRAPAASELPDGDGPGNGPWPVDLAGIVKRLPDDWFNADRRLRAGRPQNVPVAITVAANGAVNPVAGHGVITAFWMPAPFRFCMSCGTSYAGRLVRDFSRLAALGSQGRSTVTTITSLATVRHLRETDELSFKARKLLSFTDNRQDASLQAGHLNDFVGVTMLRAALQRALRDAGDRSLRHDDVAQSVVRALHLPPDAYALQPQARGYARDTALEALTEVVAYRLYLDLRRGWRITQPNLEQCGILKINYESLDELAGDDREWSKRHSSLVNNDAETRRRVLRTMLDVVRRELAIRVRVLTQGDQSAMQLRSDQNLLGSWSLEGERLEYASAMVTRPRRPNEKRNLTHLGPRSGFGQYLNRVDTLGTSQQYLTLEDREQIIRDLVEALHGYGLLHQLDTEEDGTRLWQLPAGAMRWEFGHGDPYQDTIRVPSGPEGGVRPNAFFVDLYNDLSEGMRGQAEQLQPDRVGSRPAVSGDRSVGQETAAVWIEAREHTAQVPHAMRAEREHRFRDGELPVLFCSPTMELGVDIAELNVVNMRNVPPTPANYAQRSGRAGRSGQPALVTTFCATGNSHDQHFLRNQEQMVAGKVEAPRLDLANEDLVRAHIHSVWLTHSGFNLGNTMGNLLNMSGEEPSLELLPQAAATLADEGIRFHAQVRAQSLLDDLGAESSDADWWTGDWLADTMRAIPRRFTDALDRWKSLYRSAQRQAIEQGRIRQSAGRSRQDRNQADRLRREAERQLDLLRGDQGDGSHSDFYPYRYFATEGFLPGYSFPRLPLSAFVPGRQSFGTEFLQRPRFLAISEFSPHSLIYHEGSRYEVNRVILDAEDFEHSHDSSSILTSSIKRCEVCGYLHVIDTPPGPDLCERCSERLPAETRNMFRLRNVSTRHRDRITSDEEQRERRGFDIVSAVRFADRQDGRSARERVLFPLGPGGSHDESQAMLRLTYGDTATIWRINEGPRRRANRAQLGFVLDTERGYWGRDDAAEGDVDQGDAAQQDPMSRRTVRVVPYVTDTRNALLVEPVSASSGQENTSTSDLVSAGLDIETMASLQSALSTALQVVFQLEPNEIAAEPLPSRDDRRLLLVYESAEGGAGALKQLVDDPSWWRWVAREALKRCHADPATGEDQDGDHGLEACEAACYGCLMSYSNQGDHVLLDRRLAVNYLLPFANGAAFTHDEHDATLVGSTESGLERRFLEFLERGGYRRPGRVQVFFESALTRPDFVYDEACAVVYVDGPHHDYPERAVRDATQERAMNDLGYQVIRFGHADDWPQIAAQHPSVLGVGTKDAE